MLNAMSLILTDGAARVSVNPHKQLVQLLVVEAFAKDFSEGANELFNTSQ